TAEGATAGGSVLGTAEGATAGGSVLGTAEGATAGGSVLGTAEGATAGESVLGTTDSAPGVAGIGAPEIALGVTNGATTPETTLGVTGGATARVVGADGLVSVVVGVHRLPSGSVSAGTDSNALGAASATPVVQTEGPVAHGTVHVALIHLGGTDPTGLPQVTTRADGTALLAEVTWPDGTRDTIRLPAPDPAYDAWKDQHRA
ncbi:hypothetical protein ACFWFF_14185, partial [Streptomyces sp. NPDC060223]